MMNSKLWIQKALTMCSLIALVATYSMVTLANSGKAAGELIVTGGNTAGETSFVTVNGEPSKSGRSVFSSSTISTPEAFGAAINLGKAGKISFGPNTTFTLNFDGENISGDLSAGTITVLNAAQSVGVKLSTGEIVQLKTGETATAGAGAAKQTSNKNDDPKWWVWALIVGGATVAILYAATSDNDANFGAGATTVSPTR